MCLGSSSLRRRFISLHRRASIGHSRRFHRSAAVRIALVAHGTRPCRGLPGLSCDVSDLCDWLCVLSDDISHHVVIHTCWPVCSGPVCLPVHYLRLFPQYTRDRHPLISCTFARLFVVKTRSTRSPICRSLCAVRFKAPACKSSQGHRRSSLSHCSSCSVVARRECTPSLRKLARTPPSILDHPQHPYCSFIS